VSDFNASVFLLGIAGISALALFFFKRQLISFISGVTWLVLAIYQFRQAYSGDPDIGVMTWAFGWICIIIGIAMLTAPWHLLKVVKEPKSLVPEDDYYAMREKRMADIRKRRPKRKAGPWNLE
jgi:hypothetical protein